MPLKHRPKEPKAFPSARIRPYSDDEMSTSSVTPSHVASKTRPQAASSQPMDMLVRIARQSRLGDADGCATLLTMLATMRLLRLHLQQVLTPLKLSEVKLSTLVSLYALDPIPSSPSDLSFHSQVSRPTMTDTLESMRSSGWIIRERSHKDRRVTLVRLTDSGRALVENAVRPFLTAISRCSETLSAHERQTIVRACAHLDAHFQT